MLWFCAVLTVQVLQHSPEECITNGHAQASSSGRICGGNNPPGTEMRHCSVTAHSCWGTFKNAIGAEMCGQAVDTACTEWWHLWEHILEFRAAFSRLKLWGKDNTRLICSQGKNMWILSWHEWSPALELQMIRREMWEITLHLTLIIPSQQPKRKQILSHPVLKLKNWLEDHNLLIQETELAQLQRNYYLLQ